MPENLQEKNINPTGLLYFSFSSTFRGTGPRAIWETVREACEALHFVWRLSPVAARLWPSSFGYGVISSGNPIHIPVLEPHPVNGLLMPL